MPWFKHCRLVRSSFLFILWFFKCRVFRTAVQDTGAATEAYLGVQGAQGFCGNQQTGNWLPCLWYLHGWCTLLVGILRLFLSHEVWVSCINLTAEKTPKTNLSHEVGMMPRVSLLRAFQRFYSAPRLQSAVRIRICRPMYPRVSASLCSPHVLRLCYATSFSSQAVARRILFQGLFGPLHKEAMSFGFSRAKRAGDRDNEIISAITLNLNKYNSLWCWSRNPCKSQFQ